MKKPYQLSCLFPYIDIALFSHKNSHSTLQELYPKALWISSPYEECKEKLQNAKILFLHPDGILYWKQYLLDLEKVVSLNIKLFVIADSDLTTGHDHLDPLINAFPSTQFWVQNWFGYNKQVSFLPIGVNCPSVSNAERIRPLGVSFSLYYKGYIHREEFLHFLNKSDFIREFLYPRVDYHSYCKFLSECRFSPCPMGGGYDTFRFWECLMMKTIPIVKSHVFYDVLCLYYPNLPFVIIDAWEELEQCLERLTPQFYETIMELADVSICYEDYWINKCEEILSAEKT